MLNAPVKIINKSTSTKEYKIAFQEYLDGKIDVLELQNIKDYSKSHSSSKFIPKIKET